MKTSTTAPLIWKPIDGEMFTARAGQLTLRMRRTPSGWIVSREVGPGDWDPIVGAPTRAEAERKAGEWAVAQ